MRLRVVVYNFLCIETKKRQITPLDLDCVLLFVSNSKSGLLG